MSAKAAPSKAVHLLVTGVVQGVGFRPFIYNLARAHRLTGWVLNSSEGVHIEVEGPVKAVDAFTIDVEAKAPPQARIDAITVEDVARRNRKDFTIKESTEKRGAFQLVSPDIATCADCEGELFDPKDRRFLYPFTNCTNCGPRFTIIEDIPYDRPRTTMAKFTMCPACQAEYDDPADRRFHAQPNACPVCGPSLDFIWASPMPGAKPLIHESPDWAEITLGLKALRSRPDAPDPIDQAIRVLRAGGIVAVKGLGGFQLACDATVQAAVARLRDRKRRWGKPLGVMMADLVTAKRYCDVDKDEAELLAGTVRPIALLRKRVVPDPAVTSAAVADNVAPKNRYLGVMLPYTPLHHVLMKKSGMVLIMTSGNLSEEPIAAENEEAMRRLGDIADAFLMHDRDIFSRYDDSVVRKADGEMQLIRRARGYAPYPVKLPFKSKTQILAVGPEQKNTFCLVKQDNAFVSQHIGDLENAETLAHYQATLELYERLFRVKPALIAYDLHPEYLSTKFALGLAKETGLPLVGVQHHHAHTAGVMAEHGMKDPVIGISFDGTGYGTDGTLWGGEILVADWAGFERVAHFRPVALPGGAAAIKRPARMAVSYLYTLLGSSALALPLPVLRRLGKDERFVVPQMIDKRLNSPLTSSCGRLFDAVAALLDVRDEARFEGQAAMELEAVANGRPDGTYPIGLRESPAPKKLAKLGKDAGERLVEGGTVLVLDQTLLFEALLSDIDDGCTVPVMAGRFHAAVADAIVAVCRRLREERGLATVALSGGVFQNKLLSELVGAKLRRSHFTVLTHRFVPANDGGISLGQAVSAWARTK
jgi:hydrogenase maturation protein HypF